MDAAHIAACSFNAWYPSFCDVTFDSVVLPLPPGLTDFLVQDGVFLPSSCAAVCSLYAHQAQLCDAV
jgi:D123